MEVEVGSFSDPEGLEGLAHLLGEFTASLLLSFDFCHWSFKLGKEGLLSGCSRWTLDGGFFFWCFSQRIQHRRAFRWFFFMRRCSNHLWISCCRVCPCF